MGARQLETRTGEFQTTSKNGHWGTICVWIVIQVCRNGVCEQKEDSFALFIITPPSLIWEFPEETYFRQNYLGSQSPTIFTMQVRIKSRASNFVLRTSHVRSLADVETFHGLNPIIIFYAVELQSVILFTHVLPSNMDMLRQHGLVSLIKVTFDNNRFLHSKMCSF